MKIRISNQQKIPINIAEIRRLVRYTFNKEGIKKAEVEISILLVDDKGIQELNRHYLGRRRPTDVISFRMWEGPFFKLHPEILGDVVVNVEQAKTKRELALYIVHGLLHLLGYVDDTKENARRMQRRCERILKGWL